MEPSIQEYVKCCICKEIANEAVEGQCCGSLYCHECYEKLSKARKRCSLCKLFGFQVQASMFARRIIGSFPAKCKYDCPVRITYAEKEAHEEICPQRIIPCKKCKNNFPMRDITNHMKEKHLKQLYTIMIQHNIGQNQIQKMEAVSKVGKKDRGKKYFQPEMMNSNGDLAKWGETGKYYCGKKNLIGRCTCCDGHCGDVDGENCDACQELDCQRFSVPHGYLVNASGFVCIRGKKNLYVCGRKEKKICNEEKQCKDCFKMNIAVDKLGRYSKLA